MKPALTVALAAASLFGCAAPPPEAPTELGDLSLYLYREFDHEDPAVLAAGLQNLDGFLDTIASEDWDPEEGREGREWQPPVLSLEHRSELQAPEDRDAEAQLAVAVAWASPFEVTEHRALVALPDQTPVEASSSASYDRAFLSDVECFVAGDCQRLETLNTIHRDQLILDIVYEAYKDYRLVELEEGAPPVLVARSWTEERFFGEAGQNSIDQSYSLEVWLPGPTGTRRFMGYWSEMTLPAVSDTSLLLNLMGSGLDEIFQNTDGYLAGESG